jgi:hypothetical protein
MSELGLRIEGGLLVSKSYLMRATLAAGAALESTRVPPWPVVRRSAPRRPRLAWIAPTFPLVTLSRSLLGRSRRSAPLPLARSTAPGRLRPSAISRSIRPPAGSPPEPLSQKLRGNFRANEPVTLPASHPAGAFVHAPRVLRGHRQPGSAHANRFVPALYPPTLRFGGQGGASAPGQPQQGGSQGIQPPSASSNTHSIPYLPRRCTVPFPYQLSGKHTQICHAPRT